MKSAKPIKASKHRENHSANAKFGMGDNYGTGVKQKVGRIRDGMGMRAMTPSKLKKPPKSVV